MHPKAAYLALHGFRSFYYEEPMHIRIKRGDTDNEPALSVNGIALLINMDVWETMTADKRNEYHALGWSNISNEVWARLSQELIDKFIATT